MLIQRSNTSAGGGTPKTSRFKVYSTLHTKFAATGIVRQLRALGFSAVYVDKVKVSDGCIYILFNAYSLRVFPKKYILFQTEVNGSHWFSKRYHHIISNALMVWDYCEANMGCYDHRNRIIMNPGISEQIKHDKKIPFLFYGWIEGSDRRQRILAELKKHIPVTVVTDKLGGDMWEILKSAETVINIHYYDHSPFEVFRVNEALSFGCNVISEPPAVEQYSGLVTFTDDLVKSCRKHKYSEKDLSVLDNLNDLKNAILPWL